MLNAAYLVDDDRLEGFNGAPSPLVVIMLDRLAEGATPNEAHGVKRLRVRRLPDQLIDRYDSWMLQLACDLGFV